MAINLPDLRSEVPISEQDGKPSFAFMVWWNRVVQALRSAITNIEDNIDAIQAALDAAGIAQAAADTAQAAAVAAQAAADGSNAVASLTNSGVTGCTITATDAGTDATINISAHTRIYGNGSSVAVNGGSVTGLAYSTYYYIYYVDASRAGGAVTYQVTTDESTAAQVGDKHLVGAVTTPAAAGADNDGLRIRPPGVGGIEP